MGTYAYEEDDTTYTLRGVQAHTTYIEDRSDTFRQTVVFDNKSLHPRHLITGKRHNQQNESNLADTVDQITTEQYLTTDNNAPRFSNLPSEKTMQHNLRPVSIIDNKSTLNIMLQALHIVGHLCSQYVLSDIYTPTNLPKRHKTYVYRILDSA